LLKQCPVGKLYLFFQLAQHNLPLLGQRELLLAFCKEGLHGLQVGTILLLQSLQLCEPALQPIQLLFTISHTVEVVANALVDVLDLNRGAFKPFTKGLQGGIGLACQIQLGFHLMKQGQRAQALVISVQKRDRLTQCLVDVLEGCDDLHLIGNLLILHRFWVYLLDLIDGIAEIVHFTFCRLQVCLDAFKLCFQALVLVICALVCRFFRPARTEGIED